MLQQMLSALLHAVLPQSRPFPPQVVDAPSCAKTPAENFKKGLLLYRTQVVDEAGGWWSVEARQCRHTGIILRQTKRICF